MIDRASAVLRLFFILLFINAILLALPELALGQDIKPAARWSVVPRQRINPGQTLNVGVVAFHKDGIRDVKIRVSGQGFPTAACANSLRTLPQVTAVSGNIITINRMTMNQQLAWNGGDGASWPGLGEYWAPLSASCFTSNGEVSVAAEVTANDNSVRSSFDNAVRRLGLDTFPLFVNPGGTLSSNKAWVDLGGSDANGAINDAARPFRTIGKAMQKLRDTPGSTANGAFIYLRPNQNHKSDNLIPVDEIINTNEWLTITHDAAAGGTRANTRINGQGSVDTQRQVRANFLRVKGLTLDVSSGVDVNGLFNGRGDNDPYSRSIWFEDVEIIGPYPTPKPRGGNPKIHALGAGWNGDVYFTELTIRGVMRGQSPIGSGLIVIVRNLKALDIQEDLFQAAPFSVNVYLDGMDPGSNAQTNTNPEHSDIIQGPGALHCNVLIDNWIHYNLIGKDSHYQGVFVRSPGLSLNSAFVNVLIEQRSPIRPEPEGGWGDGRDSFTVAGRYKHLMVWNNSHFGTELDGSLSDLNGATIIGRGERPDQNNSTCPDKVLEISDSSIRGNFFERLIVNDLPGDTSKWFHPGNPRGIGSIITDNHYIRPQGSFPNTENPDNGPGTATTGLSNLYIELNRTSPNFGGPTSQNSQLYNRMTTPLVPFDAFGRPRGAAADIGAIELGISNDGSSSSSSSSTSSSVSTSSSSSISSSSTSSSSSSSSTSSSSSSSNSSSSSSSSSSAPASSLSLHLKFDGNTLDSSVQGNHMTCNSGACPTYQASGIYGGAYTFNGSQWLKRTDSTLSGAIPSRSSGSPAEFTIASFIKLNSTLDRQPIISKQSSPNPSGRGFVFMKESDHSLNFQLMPNGQGVMKDVASSSQLQANRVYHVAVTYRAANGGTLQLYIDGAADGAALTNVGGAPQANTKDLEIGRYFWDANYSRYFSGLIDDLRIYNVALSAGEIAALANSATGSSSSSSSSVSSSSSSSQSSSSTSSSSSSVSSSSSSSNSSVSSSSSSSSTSSSSSSASCLLSSSSWHNMAFPQQQGLIEARFEATPNAANIDGVMALSLNSGASYNDFAVLVRFNYNGQIDARDGNTYRALRTIPYIAGTKYSFRLRIDTTTGRYDAYVAAAGGGEQRFARGYRFRSEQSDLSSLANFGAIAAIGSYSICLTSINTIGTGAAGKVAEPVPHVSLSRSDQIYEPLQPTACAGANAYLGQINVASVINLQKDPLNVVVSYRDQGGAVRASVAHAIAPSLKFDFIINELGLDPDSYGTVCVETDALAPGAWIGQVVRYKANTRPGASGYDFALFEPFSNVRTGQYTVPLNTYHIGTNPRATVANWLSLTDGVAGDGLGLSGVINYYDQKGELVRIDEVSIPDGGRQDFDAHSAIGGSENRDAVGMAQFVPRALSDGDDASRLEFSIASTRYFYDCPGSGCSDFLAAFSVPHRPATAAITVGDISTSDGVLSAIEINNTSGDAARALVQAFDASGSSVGRQSAEIPAHSTHHIVANRVGNAGFLAPNTIGTARTEIAAGRVSTLSMFYKLDSAGRLEYAFAAPFVGPHGPRQISEFNSFIGHTNIAELINANDHEASALFSVLNVDNSPLLSEEITLPPNGTRRFTLPVPNNTYGTIVIEGSGFVFRSYTGRPDEYVLPFIGR